MINCMQIYDIEHQFWLTNQLSNGLLEKQLNDFLIIENRETFCNAYLINIKIIGWKFADGFYAWLFISIAHKLSKGKMIINLYATPVIN